MKTLFRFVFATFLATTVYYYSNGSESVTPQVNLGDSFEITDPSHPNYPGTVDRSELPELCPESGRECARNTLDRTEIVRWNGKTNKF